MAAEGAGTGACTSASAQCFVYYKVPVHMLASVVVRAGGLQHGLLQRCPGLQAELLRRPHSTDGLVTLMEAYRGGLPADFASALAQALDAQAVELGPWPGPRHTEWFEPLDSA